MTDKKLGPWGEIASALKADLVNFEVDGPNLLVHLPVSYPGGAGVVVQVANGMDKKFIVADMGYGAREARNIFSERAYKKAATDIAEQAGLHFKETSVFYSGASADQLAGVVQAVGGVSAAACHEIFAKVQIAQEAEDQGRLVNKLQRHFGSNRVSTNVQERGHNIEWSFLARVSSDSKPAFFDYVKPHHASATHIAAKFHDMALLEHAPTLVAAVHSKNAMGEWLGLVSQAGKVIEVSASESILEKIIN
ncbi:MAG TPA: hypothetical protein QGG18_10175 [Rhodospirillales bacterium]|nr:hypothetical protein [Rhodospirillales bacterium]